MNKIIHEYILFFYRFSMKFIKDIKWDFSQFTTLFDRLNHFVKDDTKILVAVSGWPDSMLVSILVSQFFVKKWFDLQNLYYVHCNHKTRSETDEEELFIRSFFDWLNLSVYTYSGDKFSEDDLRQWRYSNFNELIEKHDIQYLVTGHNLTDRIESTFMNIVRGAWINGFLSMKFCDTNNLLENAKILRPISWYTKKEIESLCNEFNIPFVVDQTNLDENTSLRNYIRLSLFPQLAKISNKNDTNTCTFFESMKQIYQDIEKLETAENIGQFVAIKKSWYRNADFAYLREIPFWFIDEKVLLIVLKKFNVYSDVSKSTLSDFLNFFHLAKQWYKYINWVYFFISNGKIYVIKAKQNFWEKNIEKSEIITTLWECNIWKETVTIKDSEFIWCNLRYPRQWDKVWNKSRSEYCINKKIPIFWRNFIPVIELKNWFVVWCTDVIL